MKTLLAPAQQVRLAVVTILDAIRPRRDPHTGAVYSDRSLFVRAVDPADGRALGSVEIDCQLEALEASAEFVGLLGKLAAAGFTHFSVNGVARPIATEKTP